MKRKEEFDKNKDSVSFKNTISSFLNNEDDKVKKSSNNSTNNNIPMKGID